MLGLPGNQANFICLIKGAKIALTLHFFLFLLEYECNGWRWGSHSVTMKEKNLPVPTLARSSWTNAGRYTAPDFLHEKNKFTFVYVTAFRFFSYLQPRMLLIGTQGFPFFLLPAGSQWDSNMSNATGLKVKSKGLKSCWGTRFPTTRIF